MSKRWLWTAVYVLAACGGEPEAAPPAEVEAEEVEIDYISEGVWSPRGDRLLVTWHQGRRERLYGVLGPDTTGSAIEPGAGLRVSDGPDSYGTWSSDGLWVAFGSTRDGQSEIYRMRPDGTGVERLTDDPGEDYHPAFSPDGSQIAFISTRTDGSPRLHLMNVEDGSVRMVSSPPGAAHSHPDWSSDGSRIALGVEIDGSQEVYLATPAGGWGRVKAGVTPTWHPNGDDVFLARNDTILVARVSTGSLRLVMPGAFAPHVSKDGRWLSFVRGAHPTSALYVLDLQTENEYRVSR